MNEIRAKSGHTEKSIELETLNAEIRSLCSHGHYDRALVVAKKALEVAEGNISHDYPDIATQLDVLAELYHTTFFEYEPAEPLYKHSLEIREKALGPDHVEVATSLENLASLYYSQEEFEQAEPLFQRSLEIREKLLGTDHPDVARSLDNLAMLHDTELAKIEPLHKRSLEIREKALGPDHPDVATSLMVVAINHHLQGRYTQAEPLYKRSLEIREKAFGPDHPITIQVLDELAGLYRVQQRYEEAEPLYKRCLAYGEKVYGPESCLVTTSLTYLTEVYKAQGKHRQAEQLYKRLLAIEGESTKFEKDTVNELLDRISCRDGNCIGTLHERGYCNVCGKSLDGKHDPLRVEQGVDAKNHSALTEFQLECERLLTERLAQVGNSILNRTLMFPERWKPAVQWRGIEREMPYITGSIEGTDIEFTIYGSGADFNSSHGGQEFMVPAGVSLVGIPEEFVDAVLEIIQKEKAKINPPHT